MKDANKNTCILIIIGVCAIMMLIIIGVQAVAG